MRRQLSTRALAGIARCVRANAAISFVIQSTNARTSGRVHARVDLPAVLERCAGGHFHPEHVTSRVVPFSQAADAMMDSGPKLVFTNDG